MQRPRGKWAPNATLKVDEVGKLDSTGPATSPQAETETADERELVAAVLRKDRKATAAFVSRFADVVYSYVNWRLAPATDKVEDLVQDVFLEAWRGLARYRGDGGLAAWMVGIARHKVQAHYRRVLRSGEFPDDPDAAPAEFSPLEQSFLERQRSDRIRETMAELPEIYRFVLLWRYWEGKSAAEIARAIGRTEKAVERLLARARQQFREKYRE